MFEHRCLDISKIFKFVKSIEFLGSIFNNPPSWETQESCVWTFNYRINLQAAGEILSLYRCSGWGEFDTPRDECFSATETNKVKELLLGCGFIHIFYFHPYLGKIPILTSIFFRWVVQPPTRLNIISRELSHIPPFKGTLESMIFLFPRWDMDWFPGKICNCGWLDDCGYL